MLALFQIVGHFYFALSQTYFNFDKFIEKYINIYHTK
jgi:hypothetical protein